MFKRRLMVSVVSAGLMLAAMALPARAQVLDDDGTPYSTQYYRQFIGKGTVSLRRGEGLLPGQFVLHVEDSSAPTSGCGKMSSIPAQVQYIGKKVRIDYMDYTIDMRDQPAGLPSRCVKNMPAPSSDVILDAASLKEQGITKIRLIHHGDSFELTLDITNSMARIWPPYANKGKSAQATAAGKQDPASMNINRTFSMNGTGASTLWFYPENTVVLYIPGTDAAGKTPHLKAKLDELAAAHGMTPLENTIPEFKSPAKDKNAFYYLAKKNNGATSRGNLLENIQVETTNYGLERDETAMKDLPVFIRTIGQND